MKKISIDKAMVAIDKGITLYVNDEDYDKLNVFLYSNKSATRYFVDGMPIRDFLNKHDLQIGYRTVMARIYSGWDIKDACLTPKGEPNPKYLNMAKRNAACHGAWTGIIRQGHKKESAITSDKNMYSMKNIAHFHTKETGFEEHKDSDDDL